MQTIETFYIHTTPSEVSIEGTKENYQCLVCMGNGETKKTVTHLSNCPLITVGKIIQEINDNPSVWYSDSWGLTCDYCNHCQGKSNENKIIHADDCPKVLIKQFEEFF